MVKINKRFADYIKNINRWSKHFGKGDITFPLTQDNVDYLVDSLGGDLSPENLHCDGEISRRAAGVKYRKLMGIAKDLGGYAKKNDLVMGEIIY